MRTAWQSWYDSVISEFEPVFLLLIFYEIFAVLYTSKMYSNHCCRSCRAFELNLEFIMTLFDLFFPTIDWLPLNSRPQVAISSDVLSTLLIIRCKYVLFLDLCLLASFSSSCLLKFFLSLSLSYLTFFLPFFQCFDRLLIWSGVNYIWYFNQRQQTKVSIISPSINLSKRRVISLLTWLLYLVSIFLGKLELFLETLLLSKPFFFFNEAETSNVRWDRF